MESLVSRVSMSVHVSHERKNSPGKQMSKGCSRGVGRDLCSEIRTTNGGDDGMPRVDLQSAETPRNKWEILIVFNMRIKKDHSCRGDLNTRQFQYPRNAERDNSGKFCCIVASPAEAGLKND